MQQCISYMRESASATAPLDSLTGRRQFANLLDLTHRCSSDTHRFQVMAGRHHERDIWRIRGQVASGRDGELVVYPDRTAQQRTPDA
jgi:hypothetical protein